MANPMHITPKNLQPRIENPEHFHAKSAQKNEHSTYNVVIVTLVFLNELSHLLECQNLRPNPHPEHQSRH